MNIWNLPTSAEIGGKTYPIHADFRDILNIFKYFDDPRKPDYIKWRIAIALFYEGEIPEKDYQEAMEFLADFIACGEKDESPGPKLLDWEKDARLIVADVNKVAGEEIRTLPFLHWWTFVSYFNAIGEGQLSTIVSIRDKRRRGKKLEKWEQDFYKNNKKAIDMNPQRSNKDDEILKAWGIGC